MRLQHFFVYFFFGVFGSYTVFAQDRGPSYPFITGDGFRNLATHVFDETKQFLEPKEVKNGDIIFIKTGYLDKFFIHYHPEIRSQYVIITHNSDHGVTGKYYDYLNSSKILAWFGQNIEGAPHPKLINVPIGIANKMWRHGNPKVFSAYEKRRKNKNRRYLCYMNFSTNTYPKERLPMCRYFSDLSWCKQSSPKKLGGYLNDMLNAKFTLSPRGNGLDCHRTWEALLMGSIPIVKTSTLDPIYKDLPVLIVQDWEEVTEEFLNAKYKNFQNKKYNMKKIYINFWLDLIKNIATENTKESI